MELVGKRGCCGALDGFAAMNSTYNESKSFDRPIIARFEAAEWDLQVKDRMHGVPDGAMITPQCRSRSRLLFFIFRSALLLFGMELDSRRPALLEMDYVVSAIMQKNKHTALCLD